MKQVKCEKNIVKISTPESESTGVLLKCDYIKSEYKKKYYIIVTNAHAINCDLLTKDYRNISLLFYNDNGKVINRLFEERRDYDNGYRIIDVFNNEHIDELDVMAILIEVCGNNCISLVDEYSVNSVANGTNILVLGYPGILDEDNVNRMVKLNCIESTLFPQNENVNAYKIVDDIHYYSDLDDKMILQGLSGAPVFGCIDNSYFLLGVNKAISIVDDGKNPFKQVYYLKIETILKFLYKNKVIVYKRNDEYSFVIKWIYSENNDGNINNNKKDIKLILIGGSGSGKSSIVKSLAFNKKYIDSVGDGQTTRSTVFYKYSIGKERFSINVDLYKNYREFKNSSIRKIEKNKIFEIYKIFVSRDKQIYFSDYKSFLMQLYDDINKWFNDNLIKYDTNEKYLYPDKIIEESVLSNQNLVERWNKLKDNIRTFLIDKANNSLETKDSISFFDILCEAFEFYYTQGNAKTIFEFDQNENRGKEIYNRLCKVEGFFDIEEIEEVLKKEKIYDNNFASKYENINDVEKKEYLKKMNNKNSANSLTFGKMIDNFYEYLYKVIIKTVENYLKEKHITISNCSVKYDDEEKRISIYNVNESVEELIKYCLKVDDGKSLTGMIKSVDVKDSISENYAYIFDELDISELLLVDTCGLDHLSSMDDNYIEEYFGELYFAVKDRVDSIDNTGVIFVKKLDAGKPDELRRYLPILELKLGMAQQYLLLTGSDIRFGDGFVAEDAFIGDEINRIKIITQLKNVLDNVFSDKYKKNVFEKNISLFCGKDDMVLSNYVFGISNYNSIYRLLASIRMDEKNSIEILDIEEGIFDNFDFENFVCSVFENSSIHGKYDAYGQSQTQSANTDRLAKIDRNKDKTLGYWGYYNDQFYQLFSDGYDKTIKDFRQNKEIEEMLIQVLISSKESIFGKRDILKYIEYKYNVEEDNNGKEFRKLLEKMYENNFASKYKESKKYAKSDILNEFAYLYNPFENYDEGVLKKDNRSTIIHGIKFKTDEMFDNMFNFSIGYKLDSIKQGFLALFKNKVKLQLDKDKKERILNILRLDKSFKNSLENFKNEFENRYLIKNDKNFFYRFMQQYFDYESKG